MREEQPFTAHPSYDKFTDSLVAFSNGIRHGEGLAPFILKHTSALASKFHSAVPCRYSSPSPTVTAPWHAICICLGEICSFRFSRQHVFPQNELCFCTQDSHFGAGKLHIWEIDRQNKIHTKWGCCLSSTSTTSKSPRTGMKIPWQSSLFYIFLVGALRHCRKRSSSIPSVYHSYFTAKKFHNACLCRFLQKLQRISLIVLQKIIALVFGLNLVSHWQVHLSSSSFEHIAEQRDAILSWAEGSDKADHIRRRAARQVVAGASQRWDS